MKGDVTGEVDDSEGGEVSIREGLKVTRMPRVEKTSAGRSVMGAGVASAAAWAPCMPMLEIH